MKFQPAPIAGVKILELTPHRDERGSFSRLWCLQESADAGTGEPVVQSSLSINRLQGTLRGMHFQKAPSREGKYVHCVRGRIYDVALDLRPNSRTFLKHFGAELSATNDRALYIPPGCAHGFLTLTSDCAVLYMMTDFYRPDLSAGVRWNDPAFGIAWPAAPAEIIERDAAYPDFHPGFVDSFADY